MATTRLDNALIGGLLSVLVATTSHAQIVNGSFEISQPGDPTQASGWRMVSFPEDGVFAGRVADSFHGFTVPPPADGEWLAMTNYYAWVETEEVLWFNAGDVVRADFMATDSYSWSQFETGLALTDAAGVLLHATIANAPDLRWTWHSLSLTVPDSGHYRLRLGGLLGATVEDGTIAIDNVRVAPAPGPATLVALGTLLAARRRR